MHETPLFATFSFRRSILPRLFHAEVNFGTSAPWRARRGVWCPTRLVVGRTPCRGALSRETRPLTFPLPSHTPRARFRFDSALLLLSELGRGPSLPLPFGPPPPGRLDTFALQPLTTRTLASAPTVVEPELGSVRGTLDSKGSPHIPTLSPSSCRTDQSPSTPPRSAYLRIAQGTQSLTSTGHRQQNGRSRPASSDCCHHAAAPPETGHDLAHTYL